MLLGSETSSPKLVLVNPQGQLLTKISEIITGK